MKRLLLLSLCVGLLSLSSCGEDTPDAAATVGVAAKAAEVTVDAAAAVVATADAVSDAFPAAEPEADVTPEPEADAPAPARPDEYEVLAGDTLGSIAEKHYGNPSLYEQIATANELSDPNLILPGQTLTLP